MKTRLHCCVSFGSFDAMECLPQKESEDRSRSTTKVLFVLLLVCGAILYFWRLDMGSLETWDESVTALRSLEMMENRQWLVPHFRGKPSYHKPPLYYALTAGVYRLWGVHEGSVRLWSAVFGLLCLPCVYRLAKIGNEKPAAGLWAMALLLFNPHWMNMTRQGLLDSGLALAFLIPLILLHENSKSCWTWLGAGAALAVGAMIKNPLPVLGLVVVLMDRKWVRREAIPWAMLGKTLAVWLLLGMSWYFWIALHNEHGQDFLRVFVGFNIRDRLASSLPGHAGAYTFHLSKWWSLAPAGMVLFGFALPVLAPAPGRRCAPGWPYAVLSILMLVALTLMSSKRDTYLLLIYPFAAVACADGLQTILSGRRRWLKNAIGVCVSVVVVLLFAQSYRPVLDQQPWIKDFVLAVDSNAEPEDAMLVFERYGGAVSFYGRVPAIAVGRDNRAQAIEEVLANAPGRIYIVLPERHRETVGQDVARVLGEAVQPWYVNPAFLVYRVSK